MDLVEQAEVLPYCGLPVAFIDWTTAGPTDCLDEIAAIAWLNAQLHDDDIAERQSLPTSPPVRSSSASSLTATGSPRAGGGPLSPR